MLDNILEINGVWKWICEVKRNKRGHCTGLRMENNRKDSLRECLLELNLVFEVFIYSLHSILYLASSLSPSSSFSITLKVCTNAVGDELEFLVLQELREPQVRSIDGEQGYEW